MKNISASRFFEKTQKGHGRLPSSAQLELTYRCPLNCVHCYCKGSEDKKRELTTREWKAILDKIHKEGCLQIVLTGGDPLIRNDFFEIYTYARKKGFMVSLFTSAYTLHDKSIRALAKLPPFSIEVTLNGITSKTYEAITGLKGSFPVVVENIRKLKAHGLRVILKANSLQQNKNEIEKIKEWTEQTLGRPPKNRYNFKLDHMIYPRLNGDKTPCQYRLSFEEIAQLGMQDPDIRKEYDHSLKNYVPAVARDRKFLYHCDHWMEQFFIDPFGRLKFCQFSDKFSVDLRKASFKDGFYKNFLQVFDEQFRTDSRCRDCSLRSVCKTCPALAFLETGDEEAPVDYCCALAKKSDQLLRATRTRKSRA